MVARGKPHPDIFLHAAARLGVPPAECLVVEDSVSGVRAGVAAGMTILGFCAGSHVLGFCAGSHVRAGHAGRLLAAGATHIARTWGEATTLVRVLLPDR